MFGFGKKDSRKYENAPSSSRLEDSVKFDKDFDCVIMDRILNDQEFHKKYAELIKYDELGEKYKELRIKTFLFFNEELPRWVKANKELAEELGEQKSVNKQLTETLEFYRKQLQTIIDASKLKNSIQESC